MAQGHSEILVIVKAHDGTTEFRCPNCDAPVATLENLVVADLSNPETYAASAIIKHRRSDFLGVPLNHHGRLGEGNGYCRRRFFFWDIGQGFIKITPTVRVIKQHANA